MNGHPDQELVQAIAADLGVDPSFVEKDWHAVRLVSLLASIDHGGLRPVFSGGTSLSKAYGLIQRFSEDLDFKLIFPEPDPTRGERRAYRRAVVDTISAVDDWTVQEDAILSRNESRFFSIPVSYRNMFDTAQVLRPELRLEVSFTAPVLPFEERSLISFIVQARQEDSEVATIACVSPVETAADKMSALTWRVITRHRGGERDDPTFIRHLHDVATLEAHVTDDPRFPELLHQCLVDDAGRGGPAPDIADMSPVERLNAALEILATDSEYPSEYERFVLAMSYAAEGETPSFGAALETTRRLGKFIGDPASP